MINKAKRLEGEAVTSAPPFFQSAGRGDLKFWCRSRKTHKDQRPFEADGKGIFSNCSKHANAKAGERMDKKGGKGQSVCWKARCRQGNIKCTLSEEYASCWVYQDCHVADEEKVALQKAAGVSGGQDECQVRLKGSERDFWMGTEICMLGSYGSKVRAKLWQVTLQTNKAKWEQDIIT